MKKTKDHLAQGTIASAGAIAITVGALRRRRQPGQRTLPDHEPEARIEYPIRFGRYRSQ